ncbi:copper resistance CopC family protein [Microbacterium sediminis]|uniref:copper resistance CopC family protein n=1 Tax=Microbacterium sediminis TaxID=904291 RepID=UPI000A6FD026|nr:copper resistance protein CopC [Microbacterium sediminis]
MTALTRSLRRLPALAAAAGALLLLSLAAASPAAAHDTLVSSDPAADSTVETLPTELTLAFSAELIDAGDNGTVVEVLSPSQTDVTAGPAAVDGAIVTVPLGEAAEAGAYTVNWRVVSSDGHPTDGTFAFTVTTPTAPSAMPEPTRTPDASAPSHEPAATSTPVATDDPADGTPADGDSFARNLPWIIGGIVLAAGLGALVAVLIARARRGGPDDDATRTPPAGR